MHSLAVLSSLLVSSFAAFPQQEPSDLVVMRCTGLDGLFVDARDARLKELLALVDARLAELPEDLDGFDLPPDALPLLARLMTAPMSLRIGHDPAAEDFAYFGELRCALGTEAAARETAELAMRVLVELGMEPMGPDSLGVRTLRTTLGAEGSDLAYVFGTPPEPATLRETHLPQGVAPALVVQVNGGALLDLLAMGPEAQPFVGAMRELGLGAARMSWSLGFDARSGLSVVALDGCASALQERGLLAQTGLTRESLRPVPKDATWASVSRVDLHGVWRWLHGTLSAHGVDLRELEQALDRFTQETGVALERDLLAPLGSSIGAYASDATGGGGLLSVVLFAEVDDVDTLAASLQRIEARLNVLARGETEGYVEVRYRKSGDVELASLTFPGLPIPVEPSWALAHGYLVAGATPQAVEAALAQIAGGRPDLAASPAFAEALPEGWEGALALSYVDSARYVRDGYGVASLCMSALTNAVRSRKDEARLAAPGMPSFAALAEHPRAYVSTTRIVGNALVVETRFDRSWSVNLTAMTGYASSLTGGAPFLFVVPGMLATFAIPYLVEAREEAQWTVEQSDILALLSACQEYYINNGGVWPRSLDELVALDANGHRYLREPELPLDPWGRPYRYDVPTSAEPRPRIYTLGRDGLPGGEGEDSDVDNWMIEEIEDY